MMNPNYSTTGWLGERRSNDPVIKTAAAIIAKAGRARPADEILRMELKRARGITREQGRAVSLAVFAYFRWRGWIESDGMLETQISRATDLNDTFQRHPANLDEAELRQAVPDWVFDAMTVTPEWLRSLQLEPPVWLRARAGLGKTLAKKLGPASCDTLSDAIAYEGKEDMFRRPEFHAGDFEFQDVNSQAVSFICNPQPGETWWDACAGVGGKTLHMGDLMKGKGLIWATDRAEWRLKELKRRAARAKVFNYRAVLWDGGSKLPTNTEFHGILVDAPCSGIGTWRRNPHARWTTTANDVSELSALQKQLIANAVPALKPGACLIYSACTLTTAETTDVKDAISRQFKDLEPLPLLNPLKPTDPAAESLWLLPQKTDGNGMFICAWRRPK